MSKVRIKSDPENKIKVEGDVGIEEEYLDSIPKGWSVKNIEVGFGNVIKNFVSPSGKRFNSRVEAIRAMLLSEDVNDKMDGNFLRNGLPADGWIQHSLLPDNWFAKTIVNEGGPGTGLKFVTDTNQVISRKKNTLKYMESHDFDDNQMDNMKQFFDLFLCMKRESDDSWIEDNESLPKGWKYKISYGPLGGQSKILLPSGEMFHSRVKALLFIMKKGYDSEDIRKVRQSLSKEGWLESQYLPSEWLFKRCKTGRNEYTFLSPNGEILTSRKNLIDFMKKSDSYSAKDIDNIDMLTKEIKDQWVSLRHQWITDDPTIPKGWSIRYFDHKRRGGSCNILSPCGTVLQTRVSALQFLIKSPDANTEDINFMFDQLVHEGWNTHPKLPFHWRWRLKGKGTTSDEHKLGIGKIFIGPDGSLLTSNSAITFMESQSDLYTKEDRKNVREVVREIRKEAAAWNTDDGHVPDGWSYRKQKHDHHVREYFRLPSGRESAGRISTIQKLLKEGRQLTDPDILTLKSGLHLAGWSSATDLLPSGWFKKEIRKSPGQFKYVSPEFKEFSSLTFVYHFIKANGYPGEIVNTVKKKLKIKNLFKNIRPDEKNYSKYDWKTVDYLPPNWKTAEKMLKYQKGRSIYLSPSGILLQYSVLAYQVMVADEVDQEYLEKMKDKLLQDDWQGDFIAIEFWNFLDMYFFVDDQFLPSGWRMNANKEMFPKNVVHDDVSIDILFLTDAAQILSKKEAKDLISTSGKFSDSQQSNFLYLVTSFQERLEQKSWKIDDTLAEGWMIRETDVGFKTELQIMSPDGDIFDNFLSAYIHVISQEDSFSKEDVLKMKKKLIGEGFMEDYQLPKGWLIVRGSRGHLFEILSREGVLFQTLNDAQDFLEASPNYNDADILHLEDLCMAEVEKYVNSKNVHFIKDEVDENEPISIQRERTKKRKYST